MPPKLELAGQTFGKLTALEATSQRTTDGKIIWKCRCSCNPDKDVFVSGRYLKRSNYNTQTS